MNPDEERSRFWSVAVLFTSSQLCVCCRTSEYEGRNARCVIPLAPLVVIRFDVRHAIRQRSAVTFPGVASGFFREAGGFTASETVARRWIVTFGEDLRAVHGKEVRRIIQELFRLVRPASAGRSQNNNAPPVGEFPENDLVSYPENEEV